MAYPPISALPTPPSRQDPTNFANEADAFLGAIPTFQTETNAAGTYIDGKAAEVDTDAATAEAAKNAAIAAAAATAWVSGASYSAGDVVWTIRRTVPKPHTLAYLQTPLLIALTGRRFPLVLFQTMRS